MTLNVSIPKGGNNPGAPRAKNSKLIFIPVSIIDVFPEVITGKASITEAITLKDAQKAITVYITKETFKGSFSTEGDPDKRGYKHSIEVSHPGDSEASLDFIREAINTDFVIISEDESCKKIYGSKLNPMRLSPEGTDDNTGIVTVLKMETGMPMKHPPLIYKGALPAVAEDAVVNKVEGA